MLKLKVGDMKKINHIFSIKAEKNNLKKELEV